MIPMLAGAWLYSRHGWRPTIIAALTYGALELGEAILRHKTGLGLIDTITKGASQ